ncbi:DUF1127 domain-containing protein [Geminicoccaceae bacterium 1502E]|nr:DUF1127 domain-containing protein [Geminicoccaceae bacterium 1502E]
MATQIMGSPSELSPRLATAPGAHGPLAWLFGAWREFRRYQRTISELELLTDRELQDIGISRGEIEHTARRCARNGR